ncbi:MAG: hypothetical protein J6A29_03815 [Clostridia bacterium]|nr:hypothetical protein [Clostridia bacterium]
MGTTTIESLRDYVTKKGVGYFVNNPSEEDVKAFEGTLFTDGYPNLSYIYRLAGVSI